MTPEDNEPPGMVSANAERAADLFDRYYNRLYDFCLRVLGLPDAAADTAREAFQSALASPAEGGPFDVILFSAALDALEPRLMLRHPSSIGSNPLFHQVDVARLADATRAPSAQETGGLIWETMSRLDPADYVLLDLRFRQNLDEADLAIILRSNERAIRNRLSKLLARTEPELSSLIVGRRGSRTCEGMRRAMLGLPIAATREQVRKAVEKHARSCPICTATRAGLASPLLVLAAFSLVTPSAADSDAARKKLLAAATGLPAISAFAAAPVPLPPEPLPTVPPPPPPPVPTQYQTPSRMMGAGGIGGAGGVGGYGSGMGGGPRMPSIGGSGGGERRFGGFQLPNGMALPIVGAVVVLALVVAVILGAGMCAGGGGTKAAPTPAATKKPVATATAGPTKTPTIEETPTEEATATPEEATSTPASATLTPSPPTDTPEPATPTDTPEPPTPTETATPP